MPAIHFISDLHLSPQTPGATQLFLSYLHQQARQAEHLYILGDLFEVWSGDDCIDDPLDSFNREIVDALRALTASGVGLSIMHGNRDFLLGAAFAERTGACLIPDPYLLALPGRQFILAHGDSLCTDDSDYLAFRSQVRSREWQTAFLAKSLPERNAIAAALRRQSEESKQEKYRQAPYVMDLNPVATDSFLRAHGHATFIHGHTHHPAVHQHRVDGIPVERWVLADWHDTRGEVLIWNGERLSREPLSN
ncbi:MAG: UDP-2,3-diacylglucosamine diphosphatase [Betaproteobacteria bacterium]